jgi:hypothetical protein
MANARLLPVFLALSVALNLVLLFAAAPSSNEPWRLQHITLPASPTPAAGSAPEAAPLPEAAPPNPPPSAALMMRSPNRTLFMGRLSSVLVMPHFELPGLSLRPRVNLTEIVAASNSTHCAGLCGAKPKCEVWLFLEHNSSCHLENALKDQREWMVVTPAYKVVSGVRPDTFVVWSDPAPRARANKTLMVVNWHWGATSEKIVSFMVLHAARIPADVDIVHAVPHKHTACLVNIWGFWGYLSYLSLVVARRALPGYRGYMLSNDDAFVVWDNMPLDFPHHSWHPGPLSPGWGYWAVPVNQTATDGYRWSFGVPGSSPERLRLGVSPRNDERAKEALAALGVENVRVLWRSAGHCDVIYVCEAHMDAASHFLTVMGSYGVFLEIAVSSMYNVLLIERLNATIKIFTYQSVNANWRREAPWVYFDKRIAGVIHPAKLSNPGVRAWLSRLNGFDFGEPLSPGYDK